MIEYELRQRWFRAHARGCALQVKTVMLQVGGPDMELIKTSAAPRVSQRRPAGAMPQAST